MSSVPPRVPGPGDLGSDDLEVREELEFHLERRTEELMEEGWSREEARRRAEEAFGDRRAIERRVRREDRRGRGLEEVRRMLGGISRDLGHALRTFRRAPGFALVAVLTLGLALAGNTAIFSVLDEAILQALPFPDHEELVFVRGYHLVDGDRAYRLASVPEFRDWRQASRSLESMAGVTGASLTLSGDGEAERVPAEIVSRGYFHILQGRTALGRTFTEEEFTTPDGFPVAVLSHGAWERRFGADPDVLGSSIRVNERSFRVVGVMSRSFRPVGDGVEVWIPLGMIGVIASPRILETRGSRFLPVVGRLAPGSSVQQAQAELDAITGELRERFPEVHEDRYAEVRTFREGYLGSTARLLWVLFAGGVLLLLIAAANVANLLLVRSHARTREITVRRALGASGFRVAAQLLTESVALAAVGGAVGLLLGWWGISALLPLLPDGTLPSYVEPSLSPRVFLFTLSVLAAVGLTAGLVPAVSSARADLAAAMKTGGRGAAGSREGRAQRAFVVTQVGLAVLLLIGAGLLSRSFLAQLDVDAGVSLEGIHVFRVSPPLERYPDSDALREYTATLLEAVEAVPGVRSVAASSDFPFRGRSSGSYIVRPDAPDDPIRYHRHSVTPGYFANLGVELLAGRTFAFGDGPDDPGVAVVTRVMVQRVFPELGDPGDAVGRVIHIGPPDQEGTGAEIIGVVENLRYRNLTQDLMAEANSPDVFFSMRQIPSGTQEISFRAEGGLASVLPALREAVRSVDSATPLYLPQSLQEAYRAQTATPRFAALLMAILGAMALLLASVGVYGVLAFSVGERTREIAVRRALGAASGRVFRSVVASAVRLAGIGLLLGVAGALLGARAMDTLLFGVSFMDPGTYGGVVLVMTVVVVVAAVVPAIRATRRKPVEALSAE